MSAPQAGPFSATAEALPGQRATRHRLHHEGRALPLADVLRLWQDSAPFRSFFNNLLASAQATAFRWETPGATLETRHDPFEFVLVPDPSLARPASRSAFREHFGDGEVVTFDNLGGDAHLIVPNPRGEDALYTHLASFVRSAPDAQRHALWAAVGAAVEARLGARPLWLSTAGGGVPWLHVRLDARPKYYAHAPYRVWPRPA